MFLADICFSAIIIDRCCCDAACADNLLSHCLIMMLAICRILGDPSDDSDPEITQEVHSGILKRAESLALGAPRKHVVVPAMTVA